jgi:putative metallohydrolase (TIGR04338 family)
MSVGDGRLSAMANQDPRVDRSRGAVYQAEDSVASVMRRAHRAVRVGPSVVTLPEEVRFGSLAAIQGFVDAVLADATGSGQFPDRGPVVVEVRRGFRMATYSQGRIHIPAADPRGRWALTRSVVLHEVAHHLTGVPGHGRAFRRTLVALYDRHIGPGAAQLLGHLLAPIDAVPDVAEAEPGPDEQVRRVAALLAKAESTASAQEAEAYLAKAALVAQRHSVDMAVAAMRPDAHPEGPTHRMLTIGEPRRALNKILVSLMVATARAWSVRVDIGHGSTYVLVYGMPADLDRVEAVFATASAMMLTRAQEHVRSAVWQGTTYRAPEGGPARPVTASVARNAFCLGFIQRLGANLDDAARQARAGAGAESGVREGSVAHDGPALDPASGSDRVDLALRARDLAVNDYHRATSRARGTWRGSASGAATAARSRRAGERAADEFGRRGVAGGRRAIGP